MCMVFGKHIKKGKMLQIMLICADAQQVYPNIKLAVYKGQKYIPYDKYDIPAMIDTVTCFGTNLRKTINEKVCLVFISNSFVFNKYESARLNLY